MSGSLRLSVVVCLVFAAGCSDGGLVAPDASAADASAPLFAVSKCELAVSDGDARTEMDALIGDIDGLELSGSLNSGPAGALRNHLGNARRHIEDGKYCPALAQLLAFRDQVKSFLASDLLTDAEGEPLLAGILVILEGRPAAPPPPPPAPRLFLNAGFEADGSLSNFYGAVPTGWSVLGLSSVDTDNFGGDVGPATTTISFNFPHYVSEGTFGARLFTRPGLSSTGQTIQRTFNAGESLRLFQEVDLTGVRSIMFDAQLRSWAVVWRSAFVASVLIDGVPVWSANVSGVYVDRAVDTSALTGVHTLEFRLEAVATNIVSGPPSMWFMFDNIRLVR